MDAGVVVRTVRGLEWVAADEIATTFGVTPALGPREVTFQLSTVDNRLLDLRTVDDAFLHVGAVDGVGAGRDVPAWLASRLAALDWSTPLAALREVRDVPHTPRFDVVASLAGGRKYSRYDVENAFGPLLEKALGGVHVARSPAGGPADPTDLTVRLFVPGDRAVAALRIGARPLHRRAYKLDTGPGTLHPPVAAALARLAGPFAPGDLVGEPFAGDGTIAIEVLRRVPGVRVLAGDVDPVRVANARRNAERAGVPLEVHVTDAADPGWPAHEVAAVVTNPPWSLAVDASGRLAGGLKPFWRALPEALTTDGRVVIIADPTLDAPAELGRLGYGAALAGQVRLAGHVSHLVVAAAGRPALPPSLADWRNRAIGHGVLTEEGW